MPKRDDWIKSARWKRSTYQGGVVIIYVIYTLDSFFPVYRESIIQLDVTAAVYLRKKFSGKGRRWGEAGGGGGGAGGRVGGAVGDDERRWIEIPY